MGIPVTQYMRPNGRQVQTEFSGADADTEAKASKLIKDGYWFDAEVLMTGEVSISLMYFDKNGDEITEGIQICPNGPEIREAWRKLVNREP